MIEIYRRIIYLKNDPEGYIDIFIRNKSVFHVNVDIFGINTDCCTTTITFNISIYQYSNHNLNDQIQAILKTIWMKFAQRNATYEDSNVSYDTDGDLSYNICQGQFSIVEEKLVFYYDDLILLEKLSNYNNSLVVSREYYKSESEMMNHCFEGRIDIYITPDEININIYPNPCISIKRISNVKIKDKDNLYDIICCIFETLCPITYVYYDYINFHHNFNKTNLMYIFQLRPWKYPNLAWIFMPNTENNGQVINKNGVYVLNII